MEIPIVTTEQSVIERRLDAIVEQVCELADLRTRQLELVAALEMSTLNDAFAGVM